MRILYDRERCVGSGACVFAAPEVFDQDDDGRVRPLTERPAPVQLAAVRDAVAMCAVSALGLREGDPPG